MKAYELGQFLTEPQARCSSLQAINSREKLSNIFTHWSIFGLFLGAGSPRANVIDPFMFDLEFFDATTVFFVPHWSVFSLHDVHTVTTNNEAL